MKEAILGAAVATLLLGGAYSLGRSQELEAQGRGTAVPPRTRSDSPPTAAQPLVYGGESGNSAVSSNGFMAVTGSYGVGTSVLYLFDTVRKQLLVYEARGGSKSMRRLVMVGARRIDLDLQLIDYNDESEYTRRDLSRLFLDGANTGAIDGAVVPGGLASPPGTGAIKTIKKR